MIFKSNIIIKISNERRTLFNIHLKVCAGCRAVLNAVFLKKIVTILTHLIPITLCSTEVKIELLKKDEDTQVIKRDARGKQGQQCHQVDSW